MYNIYTTEGWTLGGVDIGENNRYLDLFTKELGLIRGIAQGVRRLESKLKYGLQDFSYSKLSLVRGKEVWRVVNVERIDDFCRLFKNKQNIMFISRIFLLLKRLIAGEERDASLFGDINSALLFVSNNNLSADNLKNLEAVLVYRILDRLGYVPSNKRQELISLFDNWGNRVINFDMQTRMAIIRQINDSLAHSHL